MVTATAGVAGAQSPRRRLSENDQGYYEAAPRVSSKMPSLLSTWSFGRRSPYLGRIYPQLDRDQCRRLGRRGKVPATTTGARKEVGNIVDGLDVSGLLGQIIAIRRIILKKS
jgi:hypothetical protein